MTVTARKGMVLSADSLVEQNASSYSLLSLLGTPGKPTRSSMEYPRDTQSGGAEQTLPGSLHFWANQAPEAP